MKRRPSLPLTLSFVLILLLAGRALAQEASPVVVVSSAGEFPTLAAGLEAAQDGDVIEVYGGSHRGHLVIDKSITLIGYDWPVVNGGGKGTVLKLTAPDISITGFLIMNSGSVLDEENSGIAGEAPNLRIVDNRLEDTLFGIYLREADGSIIRGNTIQSKDLDVPRRGDPIRIWFSTGVLVADNVINRGRDVVLWYSNDLTVRGNVVRDGRYGLHFMYCDDALIENNILSNNSVGAFLMYSRRLHFIRNTISFNHGPSGYGIGLKDVDDAWIKENLFFGNRIGSHLDNSPREVDSVGLFEGNVYAHNDVGVNLMPSVRHNQFTLNSFIDNQEQVSLGGGGGQVAANQWALDGQGNYWSDYAGYDQAGDGIGDHPYQSDRLFENLIDQEPNLRLFIYSPVAQAVDFAARAIPLVKPQPKLVDDHPLMSPRIPEGLPTLVQPETGGLAAASWVLVLSAILVMIIQFLPLKRHSSQEGRAAGAGGGDLVLEIKDLTKRFGHVLAVDRVSFDIVSGQSVALWGANGAGKTTALHCLLGLLSFEGQINIAGLDVQQHGKDIRKLCGFVPQELSFHNDLSIEETLQFYARLKKTSEASIADLLSRLNVTPHLEKKVGELSGGMKQRLALAIALMTNPPILVLDEPTSNLDIHGRDDLLALLEGLKAEGKTLLFSSHRLDEVMNLADRVLVMEQGELVADCKPDELHKFAGWKAMLRLQLPEESIQLGLTTLRENGLTAKSNGKGIWVQVLPGQKGRPLSALAEVGIKIKDFEFTHLSEDD